MRRLPRRLSITLVGAGPVGITLASLFLRSGHQIKAVIGRRAAHARTAAQSLHPQVASSSLADIPPETDLILLAVPDERIQETAKAIAGGPSLDYKRLVVFHCSGAETSDLLRPLARLGALCFSMHPIQSFPRGRKLRDQLRLMRGVWYGYEGPPRGVAIGRRLARALKGRLLTVPKQKKILYHTACVFASNYPVVLLETVLALARRVSPQLSLEAFRPLTESSIMNAMRLSPPRALTGPVVRGSAGTVAKHRRALRRFSGNVDEAYRSLALLALQIAERRNSLSKHDFEQMKRVLRRHR